MVTRDRFVGLGIKVAAKVEGDLVEEMDGHQEDETERHQEEEMRPSKQTTKLYHPPIPLSLLAAVFFSFKDLLSKALT